MDNYININGTNNDNYILNGGNYNITNYININGINNDEYILNGGNYNMPSFNSSILKINNLYDSIKSNLSKQLETNNNEIIGEINNNNKLNLNFSNDYSNVRPIHLDTIIYNSIKLKQTESDKIDIDFISNYSNIKPQHLDTLITK
jgi:hypothetical protein